jgi:hypothetical protein
MPSLTRRRDPDAIHETWLIFYRDVRVGAIGEHWGNPTEIDTWFWTCGSDPGSEPGERKSGTARDFAAARAAFESAWSVFPSKRTEADFLEYRQHRTSIAWKYAMWDAGYRLPTQTADGRSRCFCGAGITIADTHEHIYAAHIA